MRTLAVSNQVYRCSTIPEVYDTFFFHTWDVACLIVYRLDGIIDLPSKIMLYDTTGK